MGSTVGFCSFCTQHEIARFSLLRPSPPPSLNPRQRLTPTSSTEAMEATVLATGPSTARGRLRPSPRPRLSPTTATTDLATGTTATPLTATATDLSTARGRLRLSPRLRPMLRLSPTMATTDLATMDLATGATATATAMDLSTARGRLRPRLTLTTTVDTDTAMDLATAMVATVLATGPTGDKLLQALQDLNHRRKTLTLFV